MKWVVEAVMTETYLLRVVVDAESVEEARGAAAEPLSEQEGERYDCITDIESIEPLPPNHEVKPISRGAAATVCEDCGQPVHWTGRHENGETIPGPWVHS